jgi:hypothetical protein
MENLYLSPEALAVIVWAQELAKRENERQRGA